jgi:hypothetical protein
MAYIDSKMAELRKDDALSSPNSNTKLTSETSKANAAEVQSLVVADVQKERQPAGLGKLQEVDLGPDATLRNIKMTEAARKKLNGEIESQEESIAKGKKARLGKDGKPWRGRKRRDSDDIKRDMIVEDILKESRCKITISF